MPTDAELLDNVKSAIQSVLVGGQALQLGGRTITRADLKDLLAMRRELEAKIRKASDSTGGVNHASFGDPEGPKTAYPGLRR